MNKEKNTFCFPNIDPLETNFWTVMENESDERVGTTNIRGIHFNDSKSLWISNRTTMVNLPIYDCDNPKTANWMIIRVLILGFLT